MIILYINTNEYKFIGGLFLIGISSSTTTGTSCINDLTSNSHQQLATAAKYFGTFFISR